MLAVVTLAATAAGMVVVGSSEGPWWAITVAELVMLVVVFLMLALWSSAGEDARETAALLAAGTKVLGEVVHKSVTDDGEDTSYELALWIPLPDGGFRAWHLCSRCSDLSVGNRIHVLVDPQIHTWAVLH